MNSVDDTKRFLIKDALAFAHMKVFGTYQDTDGSWCQVGANDQKLRLEYFRGRLEDTAVYLLTALTDPVRLRQGAPVTVMTPSQKIRWSLLLCLEPEQLPSVPITEANVDEVYEELADEASEVIDDFRCGDFDTHLPAPSSRHYEAREVASVMPDGSWVGWTFWFGGGKHGEPGTIPWIKDAYDLECVEVMKPVKVFTKKG